MDVFSTAGRVRLHRRARRVELLESGRPRAVRLHADESASIACYPSTTDESNIVLVGDQKGNLIVFDASEDAGERIIRYRQNGQQKSGVHQRL